MSEAIWKADFLEVFYWEAVHQQTEKRYADKALATWWTGATPGVNYYRADMPAKHLPGKTVSLQTFDIQPDGMGGHWIPRQEGKAVWMFPGNTTRALIMAELKTHHDVPIFVEVDDNYTRQPSIPQISPWLTTRDEGGDSSSYEIHRKIVPWVDGVICSTPYLAGVYERLNENVHVCRNSVDPDDWSADPPHQEDGILRIGWAGSDSHIYDLNDIRPALDWAARQKDVEVVMFCHLAPAWAFEYRHLAWVDTMSEYREQLSQIDVMLCPLRPNEWANCKSDVKALEAAMAGACSIVSRTEPFRPWWDGPAYVAETQKGFVKMVKHVVANREEVRETARLARAYVVEERSIEKSIWAWRYALGSVEK